MKDLVAQGWHNKTRWLDISMGNKQCYFSVAFECFWCDFGPRHPTGLHTVQDWICVNFDQTIETRILEVRLHIGVHHVVGTVALVKSRKHVLTFCPISRKHVPAEMMKNDQFGPTVLKNGMIHDDPLPNINNATPWDSAEIFQQEMGFPRIIYVSIWPWMYSDGHPHT